MIQQNSPLTKLSRCLQDNRRGIEASEKFARVKFALINWLVNVCSSLSSLTGPSFLGLWSRLSCSAQPDTIGTVVHLQLVINQV